MSTPDVHHRVEEIGSALAALKRLGYQLVVIGQVGATVNAGVGPVAGWEVGPERLRGPWRASVLVAVFGGRRAGFGRSGRPPILSRTSGSHFDGLLASGLKLNWRLLLRINELLQRPVVSCGWLRIVGSFWGTNFVKLFLT